MEPVRIRYYGLFPMTRRTYLVVTGVAAVFAGLLLLAAMALGAHPSTRLPWDPALNQQLFQRVYNWWTLLALLVLEGLDILLTLRAFARKEAELKAHSAISSSVDTNS
jgi:hypothetical protein